MTTNVRSPSNPGSGLPSLRALRQPMNVAIGHISRATTETKSVILIQKKPLRR